MRVLLGFATALAVAAATAPAAAQVQPLGQVGTPNYDIILEVPELDVDSLGLNVEQLQAHLALDANAMNLVTLNAGVDVSIDQVQLELLGVFAEAYLYVDLDNVNRIVARVVQTLDNNPEILTQLLSTVDSVVGTVGSTANTLLRPGGVGSQAIGAVGQTLQNVTQPGGLLSQTVNNLGQTVQRTVDQTGNIVETTLDSAGSALSTRQLGNVLSAGGRVLSETTDTAGRTVRQVQDASGGVLEYTLDSAGRIVGTRVVSQGRR